MRLRSAIILVVLAGGCVGSGGALPPQQVAELAFRCPPVAYVPGDVCAGSLGIDGDRWGEPYVAAHPLRPDVFVVAVQGYGADHVEPSPLPVLGDTRSPRCSGFQSCLFVTQDTGASWQLVEVGTGDLRADPIVAFVGDRMLVAALAYRDEQSMIKVYATDDMGQTWTATEVGRAPKTDRPWFSVHGNEVMLVWQTAGKAEGWWSLSQDAGRTWGPVGQLPCNLHSQPHFAQGWIVACAQAGATPILEIGQDARATVRAGGGTRSMAQGSQGHLWLTTQDGTSFRSDTHGRSWQAADAFSGAPTRDWTRSWVYWSEAPATGGLLVLFTGGRDPCLLSCDDEEAMPVYLTHLDHDGSPLQTRLLYPGGPPPRERPVTASGGPMGEFAGIACQDETCLVAWMASGGVDYTWLQA